MSMDHGIDPRASIKSVVVDLLAVALPDELKPAARLLAERIVKRPWIALHALKRWGGIVEGEGNLIAHECGLAARDAIARTHAAPPRTH